MKYILFLILTTSSLSPTLAFTQDKSPIKISYHYLRKGDSSDIKLMVTNNSSRTFRYSVTAAALTDTGWVPLVSDIDALGKKDFLAFMPIKAGQTVIKRVSKKEIISLYPTYSFKKVRFGVIYYDNANSESKHQIAYLPPL
jgi:hypothetical protein